jgi:hypothetical protein
MIQFFFCYNQVSYVIAHEAAMSNARWAFLVIDQTRVKPHAQSKIKTFNINALLTLSLMILSFASRRIEVVIPHTRCVRFVKELAKYSKNLCYIDDGIDTFRDKPKNIELESLRIGSKYYTFGYEIPVAEWSCMLKVTPVCSIKRLMNDPKPALNLSRYDCLVVESPGVYIGGDHTSYGNVFFITHPSHIKNQNSETIKDKASGLNFSVERTISNFDGILVVGESMVLIFALATFADLSRVTVCLTKDQFDNLKCLHDLLAKCNLNSRP